MKSRITRSVLAFLLVATLIVPQPAAWACGPFFPVTIFIQGKHPDLPLEKYAAGSLGVVQPSYARSYLVVAYRYLSGGNFNSSEQKQLVALWDHRLGREQDTPEKKESDAANQWLQARRAAAVNEIPGYIKKGEGNLPNYATVASRYQEYDNCSEDAFLTAAKTLKARAKTFGSGSPAVRSWVRAQDAVFQNCGGSDPQTRKPYLPPDADKNLPAPLHSDRDYQIAAAYFYAAEWEEAEKRFLKISQDPASPWKELAAVVAVRCKLRKVMLSENDPKDSMDELADIATSLRNLEAVPRMRQLRPAIWRMRGFVEFRLSPAKRLSELGRIIENDANPGNLRQDLDDYTQLLDHNLGPEPDDESLGDKNPNAATHSFLASAPSRRQIEMTDWIVTYQAGYEEAAQHALAKWKETHSLPWLLAALSKAHRGSSQLSDLLASAAAVPLASSAYLTASFHRSRLLAETEQQDEARRVVDSVLAGQNAPLQDSARNSFLALRMKLARNLDEFLQFAPRRYSVLTDSGDRYDLPEDLDWCKEVSGNLPQRCSLSKGAPLLFDADAASALTLALPTRTLAEISASTIPPDNLRLQVAQAAWVRAVVLDDPKTAHQLVPALSSLAPDLAPLLKTFDSDPSPDSARFAAVFLILHHPEFHPYISSGVGRQSAPAKIDSYRDNWWCSLGPPAPDNYGPDYFWMSLGFSRPLLQLHLNKEPYLPDFLKEADRKTAEKQWQDLGKSGVGAVWLAKQTLAYARSHPDDPRVPEALHLVVRATRYSCDYKDPESLSKSAFTLLHKKYPKTDWAEKTPYWF